VCNCSAEVQILAHRLLQSLDHVSLRQDLDVEVDVGASVDGKKHVPGIRTRRQGIPEGFPDIHFPGSHVGGERFSLPLVRVAFTHID